MAEPVLEVHNLTKKFGPFTAVDTVSFSIPQGKVIGLLGPNGAGKTTTIHMLLGITTSSGGTIKFFGKEFSQHRQECLQRINFASSYNTLLGRITSFENLMVFAHAYQVKNPEKKIKELAEYFDVTSLLGQTYWELSAGQRTRVNLIKALLNDPELILMDEPTASLDPDIADKTLSLIEQLKQDHNLSLLYTSHNMEEVTRICDEVIFLDHGKIVSSGTPSELTKHITPTELRLTVESNLEKAASLLKKQSISYNLISSHTIHIHADDQSLATIIADLVQAGVVIRDVEVNKPSLEDVFLQIARGGKNVL